MPPDANGKAAQGFAGYRVRILGGAAFGTTLTAQAWALFEDVPLIDSTGIGYTFQSARSEVAASQAQDSRCAVAAFVLDDGDESADQDRAPLGRR